VSSLEWNKGHFHSALVELFALKLPKTGFQNILIQYNDIEGRQNWLLSCNPILANAGGSLVKQFHTSKALYSLFFLILTSTSASYAAGNYVPDENYKVGTEIMKAIFKSVQKQRFNLALNLAATVDPSVDAPSVIDVFDLEAIMAFKHEPGGIKVALQAPNKDLSKDEEKVQAFFSTDLNNKFAVMRLHRTQIENEFEGDFLFYSKVAESSKVAPDSVEVKISSELLEIKKIFLYGARIKVALPQAKNKKEDVKKKIVNALIECRADTETIDVFDLKKTHQPVEKCLFAFDGEKIRIEYKEARPRI
jgi:hypothetical protein